METVSRIYLSKGMSSSKFTKQIDNLVAYELKALFTKLPSTDLPAVGTTLRDRSPLTASQHFQELYKVKLGMVLPVFL